MSMDGKSLNIKEDLISKLKEIIPGAFTEDKLNVEQLKQILGESINTDSERYQLNWAGKTDAYKAIHTPTTATLSPLEAESVNWDSTENVFIEGENLETLKVLQKAYYGRIKGIYIDPPYNTGSDSFIYPDKFSETKEDYLKRVGEKDDEGYLMKEGFFRPNRKENGQFHSNWLSMMLPRLFLARNLLREDGIIFVSIDENEVANLKLLMDEVFGEENFIDIFSWAKSETPANLSKKSKKVLEYVLCYQKIRNNEKFKGIKKSSQSSNGLLNQTNSIGTLKFPANQVSTSIQDGIISKGSYGTDSYDIELLEDTEVNKGLFVKPVVLRAKFKWSQNKLNEELEKGTKINIPTIKLSPSYEKLEYDEEVPPNLINSKVGVGTNENAGTELEKLFGAKIFDFPKPPSLIKYLLSFSDDPNGIFLDFFAGSGATAQAILEMNQSDGGQRKFICVQLPEKIDPDSLAFQKGFKTISEISRKRLLLLSEKYSKQGKTELGFNSNTDTGFRFFKLTPSNFKIWRGDIPQNAKDLEQQLSMFTRPQKEKATITDLLWELMVKSGIPLNTTIEEILIGQARVFFISGKKMLYVLEEINENVLDLILTKKPAIVFFLDSLFNNNDSLKTNIQLKLEDSGIDFKSI
jgi:adenine-specific DNA-methyltransferase